MNGKYAIVSFIVGWAIAHSIKVVIYAINKGNKSWGEVVAWAFSFKSGGMPSGHTTSLVSMTTMLGLAEGMESTGFAVALLITIVAMYDAMHVRLATGKCGEAVNELNDKLRILKQPVKVVKGHTGVEVLVGMALGITVGWLCYLTIFAERWLG